MMTKIMTKMIRPKCKFWYVLLLYRSPSCVLCLWKRKKNRVSPPCQRWKYFARFSWSRFAEGDAARQLGSIGVFNSLRSLTISICIPLSSLTLLKVPHSQHINIVKSSSTSSQHLQHHHWKHHHQHQCQISIDIIINIINTNIISHHQYPCWHLDENVVQKLIFSPLLINIYVPPPLSFGLSKQDVLRSKGQQAFKN